jgi:hypothetical protein
MDKEFIGGMFIPLGMTSSWERNPPQEQIPLGTGPATCTTGSGPSGTVAAPRRGGPASPEGRPTAAVEADQAGVGTDALLYVNIPLVYFFFPV